MIKVLNIMISSINVSWTLVENWILMARLLNKYIAWNSYKLSDWSLLILTQSHAIVRPLNLCLLSMPPPRFATFLYFFFLIIFLAYLCIKYMILAIKKPSWRLSKKGFTIGSMNLCQNCWKKNENIKTFCIALFLFY